MKSSRSWEDFYDFALHGEGKKNREKYLSIFSQSPTQPSVNKAKLQKILPPNGWSQSSCERFYRFLSRGPAGPEIPQLLILAAGSVRQPVRKPLRLSWPHHMWTQLLVIVGYYGLVAQGGNLLLGETSDI